MRHPVTFGSRVPECPVLSTRKMRLIHETTSWEDGFAGLSRLMTPEEICSLSGLDRGDDPEGIGV